MSAPIFVPGSTISHPSIVPYISTSDYTNAATGVDVSSLVANGDTQAQLVALAGIILRASGWANSICFQTLAATQDTDTEVDVYVRRDGYVRVTNTYWPMIELDSFSAGPVPSQMVACNDTADIFMDGRQVLC
ncbi:MAG: hypothetical protein KGR26_01350, partial [Cyanobacteria bacterium REEB65]|nr:hypothetical protein [Cyanobacteria bacterium REEB65]